VFGPPPASLCFDFGRGVRRSAGTNTKETSKVATLDSVVADETASVREERATVSRSLFVEATLCKEWLVRRENFSESSHDLHVPRSNAQQIFDRRSAAQYYLILRRGMELSILMGHISEGSCDGLRLRSLTLNSADRIRKVKE
jgi:hypothetical protein